MENANITYGRLTESVHISGYSLERAILELDWLLTDNRWKQVGDGFDDINDFLKTLSFKEFKIAVEQRKEISKKLADLQASQRSTAKLLGVSHVTINSDLNNGVKKLTDDTNKHTRNHNINDYVVNNLTVDNNDEIEEFLNDKKNEEIPFFAKVDGQKVVQDLDKKNKKEIKTLEKKEEIEQLKKDIDEGKIILPEGKFQVIMMDVPWNYGTEYDAESRRVGNPYPEMSLEEIYNLDIPADDNCILFFWTTQKFINESFSIIKKYGFDYKGLIVWNKESMGIGSVLRMQCEFCMLCFKGKPIWNITDMRDIIIEKRREHSRKPETLYNLINDKLIGRKLDYFSREKRNGWETFGYEKFSTTKNDLSLNELA